MGSTAPDLAIIDALIIDSRAVDGVEHLLIVPAERDTALPISIRWARTGIGV